MRSPQARFEGQCHIGQKSLGDPVSLVAADIHHGLGPADITAASLEIPYSRRVPTRYGLEFHEFSASCVFCSALTGFQFMPFEKAIA
jgi:hypothetical protein